MGILLVGIHLGMGFSAENDRMPVSRGKTNQKVAGIIQVHDNVKFLSLNNNFII